MTWLNSISNAFRTLSVRMIVVVLVAVSILLVVLAYTLSFSSSFAFWSNFLLNSSTEIAGIALTVGFVDLVLRLQRKRVLVSALLPLVRDLVCALRVVSDSPKKILPSTGDPSNVAIDRHKLAIEKSVSIIQQVLPLLLEQHPELATHLGEYVRLADQHLADLRDLAYDLCNNQDVHEQYSRARTAALEIAHQHAEPTLEKLANEFADIDAPQIGDRQ